MTVTKIGSPLRPGLQPSYPMVVSLCQVPGVQNSCEPKLVEMLLGSSFTGEGRKIYLDYQGAVRFAIRSKCPPCARLHGCTRRCSM